MRKIFASTLFSFAFFLLPPIALVNYSISIIQASQATKYTPDDIILNMKVYFSGIRGTGIGPLAELAQDAGYEICGSDLSHGAIADELDKRDVAVSYGEQDGKFLQKCQDEGAIDWFVYTSALPADHEELTLAKKLGLRCSKRDEFLAELVRKKGLKMIAVAGTHGKTTTTSMLVWAFEQLDIPVSYLVGTTLPWGEGGKYDPKSEFFIYEADEYDRNFLAYHPFIGTITAVDYDHPDIYPTEEDYKQAFAQFESQCENVVKNTTIMPEIKLIGELRRFDASLAAQTILTAMPETDKNQLVSILNNFPSTGRRFERIIDGVYSDYGHHPVEIKATLEMARELKERDNYKGVVAIYEPHQNVRQHEIRDSYRDAFEAADKIYWLPTYLTREDPNLEIITPEQFIAGLNNAKSAESAELTDDFAKKLKALHEDGWLIILMTAGPADAWYRKVFQA